MSSIKNNDIWESTKHIRITKNHSNATKKWQISVIIIGCVKHQFEFESKNRYIPFFILSEKKNQNNGRYTVPSSLQFSSVQFVLSERGVDRHTLRFSTEESHRKPSKNLFYLPLLDPTELKARMHGQTTTEVPKWHWETFYVVSTSYLVSTNY